jgi:hypothetical protein
MKDDSTTIIILSFFLVTFFVIPLPANLITTKKNAGLIEVLSLNTANSIMEIKWVWMKGNGTADVNGTYGEQGVPNGENSPGSRYDSISWTDSNGNLWLFGGYGNAESSEGRLNDLWRYNIASGMWTWISGNKTVDVNGTYGEQGVPNSTNNPGGRSGSTSWTDSSGNLWLFGGYGNAESSEGRLNDLWRYNIASGMWTWISGNKTVDVNGIYGEYGVPDRVNFPGSRYGSVSWIDTSENLWLFGGYGNAESSEGSLSDLWRYNITSGMWTWIHGSSISKLGGSYGELGIPFNSNNPNCREYSASWTDSSGNLWLYGGYSYSDISMYWVVYNDLWRFDVSSGMWTWMAGSNSDNLEGWYGEKGVLDSLNHPGSREDLVSWIDANGQFWLFGGEGYGAWDPTPDVNIGYFNDLWRSVRTPDAFVLSSDASDPDSDGSFKLTWESSDEAFNYSVYRYSSYITQINGSLTRLANQITDLSWSLSGYQSGNYYFAVIANNDYGNTLSNCIQVTVDVKGFFIPSYNLAIIVGVLSVTIIILIKRRKL